ncbi:hypothetical protein GGR53DRAFT_279409 [Hypoxylon sp. FL1150]|nr:hypothetical protein GGR53DRAFT_279409 [Hypoxylon sp. FL1150]
MALQALEEINDETISNTPVEHRGSFFTIFTMLPLELRMIIWEYAMDEPCVVRVPHSHCQRSLGDLRGPSTRLKIEEHLHEQVAKFFRVNRECCQLAFKHYTNRLISRGLSLLPGPSPFITSKGDIIVDTNSLYDPQLSVSINGAHL